MYVIIWKYRVKPERVPDFEKIYRANGAWAELFQQANGFLGTELLRDSEDPQCFITIDRWDSLADREVFLSKWKKEYEALDAQCEDLTEQETLIGNWQAIFS